MCRVPIRCDTFPRLLFFFNLLCQSRALSLSFVFFSLRLGCVSLFPRSPLFFSLSLTSSSLFLHMLMWRRCHRCGSRREDEKIRY